MARTVNEEAHSRRRDAFLDAAERLMRTRGFDSLTIGEVIAATDASKGAFYHYFDSKAALLDALLSRMTDRLLDAIAPIARDAESPPKDRVTAIVRSIAIWKRRHRDVLAATTAAWYGDDNALARWKLRRRLTDDIGAALADVIACGRADGQFDVDDPEIAGRIVYAAVQELDDEIRERITSGSPLTETEIVARFTAYTAAITRVLGAEGDAIALATPAEVRRWYAAVLDDAERPPP